MALDDDMKKELQARSEQIKSEIEQLNRTTVHVALIGESGAGKSSLVNAILGRNVAKTGGIGETTKEAQEIPHQDVEGLFFWDLPGCGTPNHSRETYIKKQALLEKFDIFILVTEKRVREGDHWLYQTLHKDNNKTIFVVRTHFDNVVDEYGENEARQLIIEDIRRQLGDDDLNPYIVALKGANKYDLSKLIKDILNHLDGLKREKALLAFAAYGDADLLQKKHKAAEKIVWQYSLMAAANGLNPLPGVDIAVDLGFLIAMASKIISAYGLTEGQIDYTTRGNMTAGTMRTIRQIAAPFAEYLAKEAVLLILKRLGTTISAKTVAKWVPFVGQAVAASLGYALASYFGSKLIDDCEEAARKVADVAQSAQSSN